MTYPIHPNIARWQLRSCSLELGQRTRIMGVVNITPDSFSDGGLFLEPEAAIAHALQLLEEGAEILDLGAETTRPGSRGSGAAYDYSLVSTRKNRHGSFRC